MSFVIEDLPWEDPALYDEEQLEKENAFLRSRADSLETVLKELESVSLERNLQP